MAALSCAEPGRARRGWTEAQRSRPSGGARPSAARRGGASPHRNYRAARMRTTYTWHFRKRQRCGKWAGRRVLKGQERGGAGRAVGGVRPGGAAVRERPSPTGRATCPDSLSPVRAGSPRVKYRVIGAAVCEKLHKHPRVPLVPTARPLLVGRHFSTRCSVRAGRRCAAPRGGSPESPPGGIHGAGGCPRAGAGCGDTALLEPTRSGYGRLRAVRDAPAGTFGRCAGDTALRARPLTAAFRPRPTRQLRRKGAKREERPPPPSRLDGNVGTRDGPAAVTVTLGRWQRGEAPGGAPRCALCHTAGPGPEGAARGRSGDRPRGRIGVGAGGAPGAEARRRRW